MMNNVPWGQYSEAFKAIYYANQTIMTPPIGKMIRGQEEEWNPDGKLKTLKVYDGTKENPELLFTIDFEWNPDGTVKNQWRTDA